MGRRKITIKQIPDVKLRHITFNKRKNGLFKKAAELSVLCNLNLLLICEDGLGNIIQFSKNKIANVNNFLSQCNYQNVIDLTSEDYPDFSKINKKKDKDKEDEESSPEEEEEPQKTKSTRTFAQMTAQSRDQPKTRRKSPSSSPVNEEQQYGVSQRQKPRGLTLSTSENPSSQTGNGPDSVAKKNKNKLNLRLKIPKAEGGSESQNPMINETEARNQYNHIEQNNIQSERPRKQSDYQPTRVMEKNNVDFTSPPFMPMVDPLRRLGSYYESMASPFKFYGQNPRMEPLSTMLKGLSPFTFPINGTPLVPKPNLGDGDDKLFDAAAALRYMNRAGMAPETGGNSVGSHKVFTFQPEEGNLINARNDLALMNQRQQMQNQVQMQNQMHEYMNLPSAMKSELDFDINMPPETLSARRFNFDGYFKDFDESSFGDMRKKYKLT